MGGGELVQSVFTGRVAKAGKAQQSSRIDAALSGHCNTRTSSVLCSLTGALHSPAMLAAVHAGSLPASCTMYITHAMQVVQLSLLLLQCYTVCCRDSWAE
jgi:hypothetical protein